MNRSVLMIVAFVLAAVATVAIYLYVQDLEDSAQEGATVTVAVSTVDIPAGADIDDFIDQGVFVGKEFPSDVVVEGAVTRLSELEGTIASVPILAGEQIPIARISGDLPGGSLGTPEGFQAVSVTLTQEQAVDNIITQGDRVVVYGYFDGGGARKASTVVMVEEATVLAVSPPPEGTGEGVATIAVTPVEATRLIFAAANGQPWLALLPPGTEGSKVPTFKAKELSRK